jgi:surface carbohydrate biosynthesis protein (TIGR04326 family)
LQGALFLTSYIFNRMALSGVGLNEWRRSGGSLTFVSYLSNLEKSEINQGIFNSGFWGDLPRQMRMLGCQSRWLHIFVVGGPFSSTGEAAMAIKILNSQSSRMESHVTLDSFLNIKTIFSAAIDWIRLAVIQVIVRKVFREARLRNIDFSPLLIRELMESLSGKCGAHNALNFHLFREAMSTIPSQSKTLFLAENQSWELSLIHASRVAGHKTSVAVPHSSIRFWDLRYFFDPRAHVSCQKNRLPLPDLVAVNGPSATKSYLENGYSSDRLVQVEALRYSYLSSIGPKKIISLTSNESKARRVLVLTDYLASNTQFQLKILRDSVDFLPFDIEFLIKPHPSCPVKEFGVPKLNVSFTNSSLEKLLAEVDIVFSSPTTTGAVDAYCANLPVITALDGASLNLAPLRDKECVFFVSSASDFVGALSIIGLHPRKPIRKEDIFYLDPSLSKWKSLIIDRRIQLRSATLINA